MNFSSAMEAVVASGICGLLIGVAVLLSFGERETVANRVSAYVGETNPDKDSGRSLIERALGDKQARKITRSPFIARLRIEMEVADIKFGPEQLIVLTVLITVLVGWLLVSSTHSPIAALLALFVPVVVRIVVKTL